MFPSDSSGKETKLEQFGETRKPMILTYTVSTLAKLFSLDEDKLAALIEAEAVPVYDSRNLTKSGYIPTLASYFKLDEATFGDLKHNIKEEWFVKKTVNDVLTITVKQPLMPVTSYLFSEMYDELDERDNCSILLPNLPGRKLFIAEDLLISRLSQGVSDDYTILPFVKGDK